MMVIETSPVGDAALPVARLREHLRLASGFGQDQLQDGLLAGFLRAALAAIEARTGKVLLERSFDWTVSAWRSGRRETCPMAPVSAIEAVTLLDRDGTASVMPVTWSLVPDAQAPVICGPLPAIPAGGQARVRVLAGYGPSFEDVPADLAQAVLLLAAHYYEYREETALSAGCMPFGVTSLIERYRPVRLSLGAGQ